jgi:hypothetical protein
MKVLLRVNKIVCGRKNAMDVSDKLIINLIFLFMLQRFQWERQFSKWLLQTRAASEPYSTDGGRS